MSRNEMTEAVEFFKRGIDKSTLSQILLPFCSDATGERAPVALLSGNINLKSSLRRENNPVVLEEEIKRLEMEITLKKGGQVIDLSNEIKRLQIETTSNEEDSKEVEIKEDWTLEDEVLIRTRKSRIADQSTSVLNSSMLPIKEDVSNANLKRLEEDIEEMLKLAEFEEEEETARILKAPSKVEEIKRELKLTNLKQIKSTQFKELPKGNLPKITSSNPLVGDVIERVSDFSKSSPHDQCDQVSSRIILNELRRIDLKNSVNELEKEDYDDIVSDDVSVQAPLKKSSLFSLRNKK